MTHWLCRCEIISVLTHFAFASSITTAHPWEIDTLGYPILHTASLYILWCISVVSHLTSSESLRLPFVLLQSGVHYA
jgi:hypothetical protein